MAFVRRYRRAASRRSFSRPRRGTWIGNAWMKVGLTANTISSYYLMDDLTAIENSISGKLVHQRTVYWLAVKPTAGGGAGGNFGMYVAPFSTDVSNNVPSSAIWPAIPISTTTPAYTVAWFQKDMMEYQYRFMSQGTGSGAFPDIVNDLNYHGNIRVKRKIDDTEALLLTVTSDVACQFSFVYRSYWTW